MTAVSGHASAAESLQQPYRNMADEKASHARVPPSPTTADEDSIAAGLGTPRRVVDKQSYEYIVKSGIAGGLAGCAVSPFPAMLHLHLQPLLRYWKHLGQNRRRST